MSVDDRILQQLRDGKVLGRLENFWLDNSQGSLLIFCFFEAKVSSRPGQEGRVNGYLLEGQELDEYLKQMRTNDNN